MMAGLGSLMTARTPGPPTFASMLSDPQLLAAMQQQLPGGLLQQHQQQQLSLSQLDQQQPSETGISCELKNASVPTQSVAAGPLQENGNNNSPPASLSTCMAAAEAPPTLEATMKTYIDGVCEGLEARLMARMAEFEQNICNKLDLIIAHL